MKYVPLLFTFLVALWPVNKVHRYAGYDMPHNTFALTFDDGPNNATVKILDILDKYDVKATFFIVGDRAKDNTKIVKEELLRGHTVGCHTMTHPHMRELKEEEWKKEVDGCVQVYEKITGNKPSLFRFPYGESTKEQEDYVEKQGMKTVVWAIDSLDWKKNSLQELEYLKDQTEHIGRGVILLHDVRRSTVRALPKFLDYLRYKNATLVKLQ